MKKSSTKSPVRKKLVSKKKTATSIGRSSIQKKKKSLISVEQSLNPSITNLSKKTMVLIPTYNEKDNIKEIIARLRQLYPSIMIMVIDDSSPDGTADLVKKLVGKDKKLFLLDKGKKQGIGKAYIRGFNKVLELSQTTPIDYVVQMDADFSHDPAYIVELLDKVGDSDLVIGSRYADGVNVVNWPMKRVLLSYFANQYVNFITRLNIHDVTGGFKVFRRSSLEQIDFNSVVSNGYVFQIEMNYIFKRLGFKVTEVSIIFKDRQRGESKIDFQIIREAMIKVLFFPFKNLSHYKKLSKP